MTAVASPPSFSQISRPQWGANAQGLSSMNSDDVARMFMPRKSAQRANSSSSLSSTSSNSSTSSLGSVSSTATIKDLPAPVNGTSTPGGNDTGTWSAATRKKPQRTGPWPVNKAEPMSAVTTTRPQSILTANGTTAASSMASIQPSIPSQHQSSQQQNGARHMQTPAGETTPVLYLLSMNGTFERKTINVPYYPEVLRIGRQTNVKTVPSPVNGYFDSKVLSRQHAEVWADRTGKVWIRDVRSSNGTFVNGARLSAENRDSEPHELQTQDHLELGIDIVTEDQKTIVHHKVAAKVEHSGFLGAATNILDMNFGDLDPGNGVMAAPPQNNIQLRGRTSSQSSVGSNGRIGGPSNLAVSSVSMVQQRPMNFWLTPVTTEQIAKRLAVEMRTAKLQLGDLGRAQTFFDAVLSKESTKMYEGAEEIIKMPQVNGASFRADTKTRFSHPPAPPPQLPLPEKPDSVGAKGIDFVTPSLKRTSTERPRSVPSTSPIREESSSQIISLVEALATQKKELDSQNARIEELQNLVRVEREAREFAEAHAKRLESESGSLLTNGFAKGGVDAHRLVEDAFNPPLDLNATKTARTSTVDTESIEASSLQLQQKLDTMISEMREMKQQMETYRVRAETAEAERDTDRQSLAQMVEKIRADEMERSKVSESKQASIISALESTLQKTIQNGNPTNSKLEASCTDNLPDSNHPPIRGANSLDNSVAIALSRPLGTRDPLLYHTAPYASMLGVVLLGMGLMAYMNGWQKVDR